MNPAALLFCCCLLIPQEAEVAPDILKWEDDIAQLEAKDQAETEIRNGILFCGSSSIRRWESLATDMAPWITLQRGYGGAKLPDLVHYAPRLLGPHLGRNNPRRCKAIVLFIGNDISGKPKKDVSPEEVARRFKRLKVWIRQQDATIPVFWIEVTPTPKRWPVWPQIEEATHRIRQIVAQDPKFHLISTAGAVIGSDGLPQSKLFVEDQLHLNEAGYQLWSSLIKSQLHAELEAAIPYRPVETPAK